ncbi:MAG: hypothetical protein Pg6C_17700 [Treponemataceae bacterium]|nr:MAG: hypothetical protein Pg6C_17700 [Treponemataceae bacterium]
MRKYIKDNTKLAIENIVCVSARDGKIDELLHLIDAIQKDKNAIVAEVTEQRLTLAGLELAALVTDILASSKLSTDELDDRIADAKRQDAEITKRIRRLVSDLERGIERLADDAARTFDRQITNSLESLAGSPPQGDINRMTQNTVNGTAQMTLCNFKDAILRELGRLSRNRRGGEDDVRLPLLTELECLDGVWQDMPYNIDLSLPDVQHINRNIAAGVKVVGAIGIGAAVVCTMGAAAPALAAGGAATAISGAAAVGGAIKVVDTATDIASVVSNHKMLKKIEAFSEAMQSGERAINDMDNRIGQAVPLVSGKQQGFLEGLIGQITEHALAKPQRQRLISDYLSQLRAEFRRRMEGVSEEVIAEIGQTLQAEADGKRRALEDSLTRLKDERETQKSEFEARMKRLTSYKQLLPAALPAGYIDFNRKGEGGLAVRGAQRVSLGAPLW